MPHPKQYPRGMAKMLFRLSCPLQPTGRYCQARWVEKDSEAESGLSGEEYHDGTATATVAPTRAILAAGPGASANP